MTFSEIILQIEKTPKTTDKLELAKQIHPDDHQLILFAYDPNKVFNITTWKKVKTFGNTTDKTPFINLLEQLANRTLTGNKAKEEVHNILSLYNEQDNIVFGRIIKKDLKCGLGIKNFNKILTNPLEIFMVKGCLKKTDDVHIKLPCAAEHKLDGQRCVIFSKTNIAKNRSGMETEQFIDDFKKNILSELKILKDRYKKYKDTDIVIDGEIYGVSYNYTMKAKKPENDRSQLKYYIFDLVSQEEWDNGISVDDYQKRRMMIEELCEGLEYIVPIDMKIVNESNIEQHYEEVCKVCEGVIYKQLDSLYDVTDKRNETWIKRKPIITLDLLVYGIYAGKEETTMNTLGGILVKGYDENGKYIESKVGSGFDEVTAQLYFDNPDEIVGKVVLIEAQELTLKKGKENEWAIRFGVFKEIRTDKTVSEVLNE